MSGPSLLSQLSSPPKRTALVQDAAQTLEAEVSDKGGISGLAIKAAFAVVKNLRPGILGQLVDKLLDDFLVALDPFYQKALLQGRKPGAYVTEEASAVAAALLGITDQKARRASSEVLRKTYEKLRPSAQKQVEAAAPRLGQLLDRHAQGPGT